jgi:hypothetical protein
MTDQARLQGYGSREPATVDEMRGWIERAKRRAEGNPADHGPIHMWPETLEWLLAALDAAHAENQRYRAMHIALNAYLRVHRCNAVNPQEHEAKALQDELAALALAGLPDTSEEPRCHCGYLDWTVKQYGQITHKHACPARTDAFCQSHPQGCPLPVTKGERE